MENSNFKEKLNAITTFVFDIDGVLSNNHIFMMPDGNVARTIHTRDGYALQLAVKEGYRLCVISGGDGSGMDKRFAAFNVKDVFLNVREKMPVLEKYMAEHGLRSEEVLYMGDDIPDLEAMKAAGVAACPKDAAPEVKAVSHHISPLAGGMGCARDVLEQVMKVQGKWMGNGALVW